MEHHNPLLENIDTSHKFITIGETMLRLSPPNYEKSVWRTTSKLPTAARRPTSP